MTFKINYTFIFLLLCNTAIYAQIFPNSAIINEIDSLLYYSETQKAQIKIDSLLSEIKGNSLNEKKLIANLLVKSTLIAELEEKFEKSIDIALKVLEFEEEEYLAEELFYANLHIALVYEIIEELEKCDLYLNNALALQNQYNIEHVVSRYYIRRSSYCRFTHKKDSAIYYAEKGLDYALQYNNWKEIIDGNLLLGILLSPNNHDLSVQYTLNAAAEFLKKREYNSAQFMYNNIATSFFKQNLFKEALEYNDMALDISKNNDITNHSYILFVRSKILKNLGKLDSAIIYLEEYDSLYKVEQASLKEDNILQILEAYENDKKSIIIKRQNQQIIFILIITAITITSILILGKKNTKIRKQNKIIDLQVLQLQKELENKNLLLSELQHRVKNNLQHILSILDIQKESINHQNIEELIRSNQNRIHSIALLHKKIDMLRNIQEVDFEKYIMDLSNLVVQSYNTEKKPIHINIQCAIDYISIEKAMPLGLILVELMSNSIKHAFENIEYAEITISFSEKNLNNKYLLLYKDNGKGFNFLNNKSKGIGLQIIKGFIKQLHGTIQTDNKAGFQLIIYF